MNKLIISYQKLENGNNIHRTLIDDNKQSFKMELFST